MPPLRGYYLMRSSSAIGRGSRNRDAMSRACRSTSLDPCNSKSSQNDDPRSSLYRVYKPPHCLTDLLQLHSPNIHIQPLTTRLALGGLEIRNS